MSLKLGKNQYGTTVSEHKCASCGSEFTVCPAATIDNLNQWGNCLGEGCSSYDPNRDADVLFMSDDEIANHKKLVGMKMLDARNKDLVAREDI